MTAQRSVTTLSIRAWSHYLLAVHDGAELPSLEARLAAVARERYRRIDRFIALAIVGAGECVARATLSKDCGLYLASGVGPVGSNTQVQEQLCRDRLTPKPFNFVNTLGSAAGHYVGKNLGLSGQNLFLTSRGHAFQTALQVAAADLELGIVPQALVGAVEECALPLTIHRKRQSLAPDVLLAEGSHWLLLEPYGARTNPSTFAASPTSKDLSWHRTFEVERADGVEALARRARARSGAWMFSHTAEAGRARSWADAIAPQRALAPSTASHDSRDAALLTGWLAEHPDDPLTHATPLGRAGALLLSL